MALILSIFSQDILPIFIVAGVGFLTGLALGHALLPDRPEWQILVVAIVLALIGAVLAVVAKKVIIAVAGFLAGGGIGYLLLRQHGITGEVPGWVVYVLAGIVGLVLMRILFEWALILLSSLAGAGLLLSGVEDFVAISPETALLLAIAVAVIGIVVQVGFGGPHRGTPSRSR